MIWHSLPYSEILEKMDGMEDEIIAGMKRICSIPAIGPENGGEGEVKKAEEIVKVLKEIGIEDIEYYKAPDETSPDGYRPNIVATIPGTEMGLPPLWVVTHMDVVPISDETLWTTPPFQIDVRDGKVYGRGVEDNGHALIASIYAAKAVIESGIKPKRTIKLCFVSNEEAGSNHGIKYLIDQKLFNSTDLVLVPDSGESDGSKIQIVEKSRLVLEVRVLGVQAHSSNPGKGINALMVAGRVMQEGVKALHEKYDLRDDLYNNPFSTFAPTKFNSFTKNLNTVPGEALFYLDCRILPQYDLQGIVDFFKAFTTDIEAETGAKIEVKAERMIHAPSATPVNAPIVNLLREVLRKVRKIKPDVMGIGGGTCASLFRRSGINAAVWITSQKTDHLTNEYVDVEKLMLDAKTFAALYLSN